MRRRCVSKGGKNSVVLKETSSAEQGGMMMRFVRGYFLENSWETTSISILTASDEELFAVRKDVGREALWPDAPVDKQTSCPYVCGGFCGHQTAGCCFLTSGPIRHDTATSLTASRNQTVFPSFSHFDFFLVQLILDKDVGHQRCWCDRDPKGSHTPIFLFGTVARHFLSPR